MAGAYAARVSASVPGVARAVVVIAGENPVVARVAVAGVDATGVAIAGA